MAWALQHNSSMNANINQGANMRIYPTLGKPVLVPVYAKDRTTIFGYVSRHATSIGAAKIAGCPIAGLAFVENKPAWVAVK